jgi:integrase
MVEDKKRYLPLKYFIDETIRVGYWDKATGRAIERKLFPHHALLNIRLRMIENAVHYAILDLKNRCIVPSRERLREMLDIKLQKNKYKDNRIFWNRTHTFISFIEQYIERNTHIKAPNTIKQYANTLRLLKDFAREKNRNVDFEDINLGFHTEFRGYMNELGYSDAYFGNQIKFIRLFMNEATEQGINTQIMFKSKKFSSPTPDVTKIYLTEEEITRIQRVNLGDNRPMTIIRDLFIVACRTGLRFSDLIRLKPSNFMEQEKILRIETQKTGAIVYIPLAPDVLRICQRYNFSFPRITNTVFNISIKRIACMAGIEDDIEVVMRRGNEQISEIIKKYKLVSAHTARRSFATNAYLANVPSIAIMRITGHNTEKSFMRYIRIASENNARQLLTHPHFLKDRSDENMPDFLGEQSNGSSQDFLGGRSNGNLPDFFRERPDGNTPDFLGDQPDESMLNFFGERAGSSTREFSGERADSSTREFSGERTDSSTREFSGERTDESPPEFSGEQTDESPPEFSGEQTDNSMREFSGERADSSMPEFSGERPDSITPEFSGDRPDG